MTAFGIIWALFFLVWDVAWAVFAYYKGQYKATAIFSFCASIQFFGLLYFVFMSVVR